MAERQVVRQDVVQIGFDVKDGPLKNLVKSMNEFANNVKKMSGADDALDKIKDKSGKASKALADMADKAKNIKSKLQPALTKIDNGLKAIGKSAINAGKKIASGLGSAAKLALKGAAAGVAAFAGLTGAAVKNYAEYEQLVGGVETLFKTSRDEVMKYANDAYKTAGLSANAYMETVTSFSASLLQSVDGDTAKAAKLANQAIIDMSDNANKMGTDMELIQNAYMGFSKQNYTMLDNLKLGYGGTKEEMKRLLADAEKLSGKKFDLSSYADITEAIHIIQENMGIAGTTAKEASSTIQGSLSAMKSSWSNFLTGMADPEQNFDQLVDNLIDSVVTFSKNLIPVIKRTAPRLAQGLAAIGKEVAPHIPPMMRKIGAKIVEYVPTLGAKFKELLLKAKDYLIANKGAIWDGFKTVVAEAIAMLGELFTGEQMDVSEIKDKIQEITDKVVSFASSIKEHWPVIKGIILGVAGVIGTLKLAMFACNAVIATNNALTKVKAAGDILMAAKTKILNSAVWSSVKAFGAQALALMTNPVTWIVVGIIALIAAIVLLVKHWDKVKEVAKKCWDKIKETWGKVKSWFNQNVVEPVKKLFASLWEKLPAPVKGMLSGIFDKFKNAFKQVKTLWGGLKDFFEKLFSGDLKGAGEALKNTFVEMWKNAVKAVAKPVNKLIDGANWVLEKVGSDKVLAHWEPYAKGTNGHPGGNALVNDGRGAELVQMPNGSAFIPKGRNVMLPNAPKGMKVLDAERTAQLMGKKHPTFNYAGGIGDWGIWDFFDDAKGLVGKVIEKFVSFKDMSGYALDVGKGMIGKATSAMSDWIKGLFKKFGGKSLGDYDPSKGVEQWRSTVVQALKMEGLHSAANVTRTLNQMQTESGGNPKAINNWDINAKRGTPSKGLMQVIDPTFNAYARKGYNTNIYDPLSNILASVRYAVTRYGSLEKAYKGVGYADGVGFPRLPSYSPSSSVGAASSHTQNNSYAPQFTLNLSGTVDRTTERTVKKWVQEAIEDVLDSMSRTNPRVTEV